MSLDLSLLTIKKASLLLSKKEISAVELSKEYLKNIEAKNKNLNAYLEVFDDVEKEASRADTSRAAGSAHLLCGIPLGIKDNILIKGKRASAASKMLEGYVATYDATAISKLKEAGALFLGRTNMDEFATGSSTESSAYGITKNPFDESRVPGGSSGGSAAVVAADLALGSLGTDTAGSVRQPASFCGVVGLKPSYGAVSRSGIIAMGSSLDQIGPMAKTVTDTEIIFNAIAGKDRMDSTSIDFDKNEIKQKITVGVPWHFLEVGLDKDVLSNFKDSIKKLESLGYETKEIELKTVKYSLPSYYVIMPAELSTNLARFDGVRYGLHKDGATGIEDYKKSRGAGFGREVRRRILLGTYVLSSGYYDAYYNKAVAVRESIKAEFSDVFKKVDVIATPTSPTAAFKIGEKINDPIKMYLSDIFTTPANIAGIPGISIPSGFSEVDGKKLPLGLQFMASHGGEATLFAIGKKFLGEE